VYIAETPKIGIGPMKTTNSRYSLVRDDPDPGDYLYPPKSEHVRKRLPSRVDLRRLCPPVQDQGKLGTCTAHAVAAAIDYERRLHKKRAIRPSRLFIYYNERPIAHEKRLKPTVNLRDALKVAAKHGACPETMLPYNVLPRATIKKPLPAAYKAAAKHRIAAYYRISHGSLTPEQFLHHLKSCLADRHPFVFGFKMHPSFVPPRTEKWEGWMMPIPQKRNDRGHGGHAVMAVGYDDRKQAVLVRNSWGTGFGIKGYFWMPYSLISDSGFAHDFWTIRGIIGEAKN
jgi:C1A family cysteine protease